MLKVSVAIASGGEPSPAFDSTGVPDFLTSVAIRTEFDSLSHRGDVPGAAGVREVKFLITRVDTPTPKAYLINSERHQYHYFFARDVLGIGLSNQDFNRATYFTDQRRFIAGTVI